MKSATALVLHGVRAQFQVEEVEIDSLRPDEVYVQMKATSICATDTSVQKGTVQLPLPIVLGHEGAGIIIEIGSQVSGLAVGDHVVLSYDSREACRHCKDEKNYQCKEIMQRNFGAQRLDQTKTIKWEGNPISSCFFGQSSFCNPAVVRAGSCVKVVSSLDLSVVCALGCGVQTGAGAIFNVVKPVEKKVNSLAIFGLGAVGIAALMAAKVIADDNPGVLTHIIVVDVNESRLNLARDLGATHIIHSSKTDVKKEVMEITTQEGLDAGVDCTGVIPVINDMIELIGQGGTAVTVGNPPAGAKASVEIFPFILGSKTYCASHQGNAYSKTFIPFLAKLFAEGRFPVDRLQKKYKIEDINQAIADMSAGSVIKPVLVWEYNHSLVDCKADFIPERVFGNTKLGPSAAGRTSLIPSCTKR